MLFTILHAGAHVDQVLMLFTVLHAGAHAAKEGGRTCAGRD